MIQAIDVPRSSTGLQQQPLLSSDDKQEDRTGYEQLLNSQRLRLSRQSSSNRLMATSKMVEKSVIVHRDENGFGLRLKGQAPVFVEHVHENGSAWRAGVRPLDRLSKVNGIPVGQLDHKEVILLFKSCSRFVGLTLFSYLSEQDLEPVELLDGHSCCRLQLELAPEQRSSTFELTCRHSKNQLSPKSASSNRSSTKSCRPQLLNGNDQSIGRYQQSSYNNGTTNQSAWMVAKRSDSVATQSSYLIQQMVEDSTGKSPVCGSCRRPIKYDQHSSSKSMCHLSCLQCNLNQSSCGLAIRTESTGECQQLNEQKALHQSSLNKQKSRANGKTDCEPSMHKLAQSASTSSLPTSANQNQRVNKTSEEKSAPPPKPKAVNKRLEIIREFIDTERTHTDRLRCLDELFYRPLKTGGYMTSEQLRQVFSCHRTLYKIHRQIYRILLSANHGSSALYNGDMPLIGSALLEIFEGELKRRLERAACSFCAAQSTNVELLNKLTRRDSKVGEFLAHVTSQQMVGRLGIKDLLASCFQRLTKYPLLLESLLKATPASPEGLAQDQPGCSDHKQVMADLDDNLRDSQRILAISLAEEREFIERALYQSRQILIKVNDSVKVTASNTKLKEIWKRTEKQPGLPAIDITKQQVIHEGQLTLRLSKRSFEVYVLLLTDYILLLTREGQDKYKLKFFTPEGKSSSSLASSAGGLSGSSLQVGPSGSFTSSGIGSLGAASVQQTVFSPVFIIDEHLTTRDAATDENGFYLLCKRKDDSRIYEFASQSPAERIKWRDRIQWSIDEQISRADRRPSCESTITKSSSEISANKHSDGGGLEDIIAPTPKVSPTINNKLQVDDTNKTANKENKTTNEPTKIEGTISYVEDDGIVMPSKMEYSQALVEQAVQVNIF